MTIFPVGLVLAIDPGPEQSAYVLFDGERICDSGVLENEDLRRRLKDRRFGRPNPLTVIEKVESFGMAVGADIFETIFWSGRFAEASEAFDRVSRRDVKLHLCQSARAKDANVRQALVDRFGGQSRARGTKAARGPLYGVSSHQWAALGVAVTWWDGESHRVEFVRG